MLGTTYRTSARCRRVKIEESAKLTDIKIPILKNMLVSALNGQYADLWNGESEIVRTSILETFQTEAEDLAQEAFDTGVTYGTKRQLQRESED
jgi:hypothetical protein